MAKRITKASARRRVHAIQTHNRILMVHGYLTSGQFAAIDKAAHAAKTKLHK